MVSQVVTKEEARLDGGYETRPIEGDHMGMCKCKDREDPVYQVIVGVLRRWVERLEDDAKKESSQAVGFSALCISHHVDRGSRDRISRTRAGPEAPTMVSIYHSWLGPKVCRSTSPITRLHRRMMVVVDSQLLGQ